MNKIKKINLIWNIKIECKSREKIQVTKLVKEEGVIIIKIVSKIK